VGLPVSMAATDTAGLNCAPEMEPKITVTAAYTMPVNRAMNAMLMPYTAEPSEQIA